VDEKMSWPNPEKPFREIATGFSVGCGILRDTSLVECWGNLLYGSLFAFCGVVSCMRASIL
jgi:hypothetical protein